MVKPLFSVVRYTGKLQWNSFEEYLKQNDLLDTPETREWFEDDSKHETGNAGRYMKAGGGDPTSNLQEAQLFGWSRQARKKLQQYRECAEYEVFPVRIVLAEE